MTRELDTAHARHVNIDQSQLGAAIRKQGKRLNAAGGFADNLSGRVCRTIGEHFAQARARGRLVIDQQNSKVRVHTRWFMDAFRMGVHAGALMPCVRRRP